MSERKYIQEDKTWSSNRRENKVFKRLATAWNAIHGRLASNQQALCTSLVEAQDVFVVVSGQLLRCEAFENRFLVEGIDPSNIRCLNDFYDETVEDLEEFAVAMEEWLAEPSFITAFPGAQLVGPDLIAEIALDHWDNYAVESLTGIVPESFRSHFTAIVRPVRRPDFLDFRA